MASNAAMVAKYFHASCGSGQLDSFTPTSCAGRLT